MIWVGISIIIASLIIADGFTVLGHIIARAIKEKAGEK